MKKVSKFKTVLSVSLLVNALFAFAIINSNDQESPSIISQANASTQTTGLSAQELDKLVEVYAKVKSEYVATPGDGVLIENAVKGLVAELDPHSSYLTKEGYKELTMDTTGEFAGVGLEVNMENKVLKVVAPIEDSPAFNAGIHSGDLIVKIDDTSVEGLTLEGAVKKMRGKPNTKVKLTIARQSEKTEDRLKVIEITRAVIHVKSVKAKMLENQVAYFRINSFQSNTLNDLIQSMNKVEKDHPRAIVLDLRDNPGGLLNAGIGVAAVFLKRDDLVVYTQGRDTSSRLDYHATPNEYLYRFDKDLSDKVPAFAKTAPVYLLVNGGSASASEIVSAALQDYGRATIMGETTFGKGSVQTLFELSDGSAIKLTTAQYYSPKGRVIQTNGVIPEVEITSEKKEGARTKEKDLEHHIIGKYLEEAKTNKAPVITIQYKPQEKFMYGDENDEQLKEAVKYINTKDVSIHAAN